MKHFAEARPYAHAAYQFAVDQHQVESWHGCLMHFAKIFQDASLKRLFKNPKLTAQALVELLAESYERLDSHMRNFLSLLAQKKRLSLLPEILEVFEQDWFNDQNLNEVVVTFAAAPETSSLHTLSAQLKEKFGSSIELKTTIDPSILSGAIIQKGDYVIDGSLKGQLERLKQELSRA